MGDNQPSTGGVPRATGPRTARTDGDDPSADTGVDHQPEDTDRCPRMADGGTDISTSIAALANERRRFVLYYLRDEGEVGLEDVTEHVAAWELDTSPDALSDVTRRNVRVDLHHAQLPKLEDAGIIRYDRRHRSLSLRDPPAFVEDVLDHCATVEVPPTDGKRE